MASSFFFLDNGRRPFSNALDTTLRPLAIKWRCGIVVEGKNVVAKLHRKRCEGHGLGKFGRIRDAGIQQ